MNGKMKSADLFCGCGGMSLGFQTAGFNIAAAYDNWAEAVSCYNTNFKTHKAENANLTNVDDMIKRISVLKPDILVGGPPVPGFLPSGKAGGG